MFQVLKCSHFLEIKDTRENNVIPWETPRVVLWGRIPIKPPTGMGLSLLHLSTRLALLTLARCPFTFRFVLIRGPINVLGCVQTDATTPNIVAPTMLGVVAACVLAVVRQQLPTMLGPTVHCGMRNERAWPQQC